MVRSIFPISLLLGLVGTGIPLAAQQPVLNYTLAINADDVSSAQVIVRLRNLPAVFHLAMARHFLVDDRYWRYVEDLQITPGSIAQEQDGLWRVSGTGSDTTVRYKIRLGDTGGGSPS